MKAIITKYRPFTTYRPAKMLVSAEGVKTLVLSLDSDLSTDENHIKAAQILAKKYNWNQEIVSGVLPNGDYAHCFISKERK